MNIFLFGLLGMWETIAILAVVLVLFGAKKVPELAKGLGQGIKEFKKASRDVQDELSRSMEDHPAPPPVQRPPEPRKIAAEKPAEEPADKAKS
jgi:sec-independent protein translocase protein TatA